MNIEYELGYYLDTKESNGAFLICGSRGSGKSHIVRQYIADKKNCESSFFVMLSLFGISSVESLTKAIKENIAYRAVIPSRLSKSNQKANLSDTHAGRLIQFIGIKGWSSSSTTWTGPPSHSPRCPATSTA